jgi:hypothetical protein
VSPGFILPFCQYRPVQADAGLPAWSSLPTELEYSFKIFIITIKVINKVCFPLRTQSLPLVNKIYPSRTTCIQINGVLYLISLFYPLHLHRLLRGFCRAAQEPVRHAVGQERVALQQTTKRQQEPRRRHRLLSAGLTDDHAHKTS